jgi:hypothetical protein
MLAANRTHAQGSYYDEPVSVFTGGLVAGMNFATLDDDEDRPYDKLGANLGGVVFTRLREHLDISMEMLYSQKGEKSNQLTPTGTPGVNFTYIYDRLNYVEIPVMLNYVDRFNDHYGVGFSYGRLVNSTEILNTDSYVPIQTSQYSFNKDDYEFLIGTEFHLWKHLYATFRFQYSMVKIQTVLPTNYIPNEQNNNLFVLRVVYLLNKSNIPSILKYL